MTDLDDTASDDVGSLLYSWQIGDAEAGVFGEVDTLDVDDLAAGVTRVGVRAIDTAGNVSKPVVLDVRKARQLLVDEREAKGGAGCASTSTSTSAVFALALLALLRRRRR